MPLALKGASETLRDLFLSNMSERASKMLKEDMAAMGKPVDQPSGPASRREASSRKRCRCR